MSYALARHKRAYDKLGVKGQDVTFTYQTSTYDPTTDDNSAPSTFEVAGRAVNIDSDPKQFAELNLSIEEALTLFFIPEGVGQYPPQLSTVIWDGTVRKVRAVTPIRPTGIVIAAKVVLV